MTVSKCDLSSNEDRQQPTYRVVVVGKVEVGRQDLWRQGVDRVWRLWFWLSRQASWYCRVLEPGLDGARTGTGNREFRAVYSTFSKASALPPIRGQKLTTTGAGGGVERG